MRSTRNKKSFPRNQDGALILVTLLILLVVSVLGMSSMDSTGLEMQMASNSRAQQQAFEAAEYTLSWVENSIQESGYFSTASLSNASGCGSICFNSTCSNGYCFAGTNPTTPGTCLVGAAATEPYEAASIWSNSSFHKTLAVPNTTITAKYIVEFRCYTSRDPTIPFDGATNSARLFRITAYAVAEGGRGRVMLRSSIKEV